MRDSHPVHSIQRWYPQIYLACHTSHKRARTTSSGISERDSSILAHLDEREPMTANALARHLGIGAPSMSAAIKRLSTRGYIFQDRDVSDRRRRQLRLTPAGVRALADGSVLETSRVRALVRRLTDEERSRALDGLALLARAARELAARRTQ